MNSRAYKPQEDSIIIQGFEQGLSDFEIAKKLKSYGYGRTSGSVKKRRQCLALNRFTGFTKKEDKIIKNCFQKGLNDIQIKRQLNWILGVNRGVKAIQRRRWKLNLYKMERNPMTTEEKNHLIYLRNVEKLGYKQIPRQMQKAGFPKRKIDYYQCYGRLLGGEKTSGKFWKKREDKLLIELKQTPNLTFQMISEIFKSSGFNRSVNALNARYVKLKKQGNVAA